jgi:hypothetical protein
VKAGGGVVGTTGVPVPTTGAGSVVETGTGAGEGAMDEDRGAGLVVGLGMTTGVVYGAVVLREGTMVGFGWTMVQGHCWG